MAFDNRSNRQILYEAISGKIPKDQLVDFPTFSKLLDDNENRQKVYDEATKSLGIPLGTPEQFAEDVAPTTSFKKDIKLGMQDLHRLVENIAGGIERTGLNILEAVGFDEERRAEVKENYNAYTQELVEAGAITPEQQEKYQKFLEPVEKRYEEGLPYKEETLPQGPGVDYGQWTPRGLAHTGVQSLPQVAGYASLFILGPGGMGLAGVGEMESVNRDMDQWEEETGQKVDPFVRATVPVLVGAVNVMLERMSFSKWEKMLKAQPGLKRLVGNYIMASLTESTEEVGQELLTQIAKLGYDPNDFDLSNIPEAVRQAVGTNMVLGPFGGAAQFKNKTTGEMKPWNELTVEEQETAVKQIVESFDDAIMQEPGFKDDKRIVDRASKLVPKNMLEESNIKSLRRILAGVAMREESLTTGEARFLASELIEAGQRIDNSAYRDDYDFFQDLADEANRTKLGKLLRKKGLEKHRKEVTQALREFREVERKINNANENISDADTKLNKATEKLAKATEKTKPKIQKEIAVLNQTKENNQKVIDELYLPKLQEFQTSDSKAKHAAIELAQWFDTMRQKVIASLQESIIIEKVVNRSDTYKEHFKDFISNMEGYVGGKATYKDIRKHFEEVLARENPDLLVNDEKEFNNRVEEFVGTQEKPGPAVEYYKTKDWGKNNYITNIEIGQWKVKNADGQVVAIKETRKKARERANELAKTEGKFGYKEKGFSVTPEFEKPLDPLAQREDVLQGEDDVFKALKAYSPKVRTFIEMNPMQAMINQQSEKGTLNSGEVDVLNQMITDTKSVPYTFFERFFDSISSVFGRKGGFGFQSLRYARKVQAVKKLGARVVGGLINSADGMHKIWVKNNIDLMKDAMEFIQTQDFKDLIEQEQEYLGVDFVTSSLESQYLKKNTALLKKAGHAVNPVFFHAWPEPMLRKFS
jgi:methyl-accepting chemotaxis protein